MVHNTLKLIPLPVKGTQLRFKTHKYVFIYYQNDLFISVVVFNFIFYKKKLQQ